MTEFAAGTVVLGLLLLGTLVLAGLQEVDRRGIASARQVAWEESWRPGSASNAQAVDRLRRVMFRDAAVEDPTGHAPYVADDALSVRSVQGNATGVAGGAAELLVAPLRVTSGFLGNGFDLDAGRFGAGEVSMRIEPMQHLPAPFRTTALQLSTPYSLLGDAWHAGGSAHVRARASGLVPTNRLSALDSLWRPLSVPIGIIEPSLRDLCLGLIEPDRIPEDRLGPGRTPRPEGCR